MCSASRSATIFSHAGGYASEQQFVAGLEPALWVAAAVVAVGALAALALPGRQSATVSALPARQSDVRAAASAPVSAPAPVSVLAAAAVAAGHA